MQIKENATICDVIIVGSGAGGGMATKILSEAGLKVALIEAGPYFDPKDKATATQMKFPWESPKRGASTNRAFGDFDMSWGDWKVDGEPYTQYEGTDFTIGGATMASQLIEDIAYPDPGNKKLEMLAGINFFNLIRNLTVTGYYTTRIGFDDLEVTSNFPNIWDGVPDDVLADHDVSYDSEWLSKCVDQTKRMDIAEWDEQGNLLT